MIKSSEVHSSHQSSYNSQYEFQKCSVIQRNIQTSPGNLDALVSLKVNEPCAAQAFGCSAENTRYDRYPW